MSRPQAIPTNPSAFAFVCSPRWFHHSQPKSQPSSHSAALLHPLALNALPAGAWPLPSTTALTSASFPHAPTVRHDSARRLPLRDAHAGPLLTLDFSLFELSLEMPDWPLWSERAGHAVDTAVDVVLDPLRAWVHASEQLEAQTRRQLKKKTIAAAIASMALLFALGVNPKRVAAQAPTQTPGQTTLLALSKSGAAQGGSLSQPSSGMGFRLAAASVDADAPISLAYPSAQALDFNGHAPVASQGSSMGHALATPSLEWSTDIKTPFGQWQQRLKLPKSLNARTGPAENTSTGGVSGADGFAAQVSAAPSPAGGAQPALLSGSTALTADEQKLALSGLSQRLADEVNGNPSNIRKWTSSLIDQARQRGIEPMMALAVMSVESKFDANAHSKAGAVGLMQIMPGAHREELSKLGAKRASDPISNIAVGLAVLDEARQKSEKVGGGWSLALSYYNGSAKDRTRAYAKRVLREKQRLEQLLRGQESLASQGDETLASTD